MRHLIRTILAALTAVLLMAVALASPAAAATADAGFALAFSLDPLTVVQFLLAIALPILVGLVTTRVTSSGVKAWLLAGLTVLTSLLTELARALTSDVVYDLGAALMIALPAFAVSVAMHYGLWKPTGTADAVMDLGRTAPGE